jgi:hypothetical protein
MLVGALDRVAIVDSKKEKAADSGWCWQWGEVSTVGVKEEEECGDGEASRWAQTNKKMNQNHVTYFGGTLVIVWWGRLWLYGSVGLTRIWHSHFWLMRLRVRFWGLSLFLVTALGLQRTPIDFWSPFPYFLDSSGLQWTLRDFFGILLQWDEPWGSLRDSDGLQWTTSESEGLWRTMTESEGLRRTTTESEGLRRTTSESEGTPTDYIGVWGTPTDYIGVWGIPVDYVGVWGTPTDCIGVWGTPTDCIGVWGTPTDCIGVWGILMDYVRVCQSLVGIWGTPADSSGLCWSLMECDRVEGLHWSPSEVLKTHSDGVRLDSKRLQNSNRSLEECLGSLVTKFQWSPRNSMEVHWTPESLAEDIHSESSLTPD